jgi:adenylate cyclase
VRLTDAFDFGTERYAGKVARRLRVLNLACWSSALLWLSFAVLYFPDPELRNVASIDLVAGIAVAAIPVLHRLGPRAAVIALAAVNLPATFVVCFLLGTDTGMQMFYLIYGAGAVLIVGVESIGLLAAVTACALALIITLEMFAPKNGGLLSEAAMLGGFIGAVSAAMIILFAIVFYAVREASKAEALAEFEFQRSESLLVSILPAAVTARLKSQPDRVIADRHDEASILFADMAGFTSVSDHTSPVDLVSFLNDVFTTFDRLVERHGLEKIKTTGDSYMVVSGVPVARPDHAAALVRLAVGMLDAAGNIDDPSGSSVSIRIGIASGPVVAGVVGMKKFFYDVWGDAVNVASRMESTGIPGRIQVSTETYEAVKSRFAFERRDGVEIKGKGQMTTWLLK